MIATTVDESGTRRAVTKLVEGERLVSCTCCTVEECCTYPASGLGRDKWDNNDLPDTLEINWAPDYAATVVTKSGSSYTGSGLTLQIVGGSWVLSDDTDSTTVGICLLKGAGGRVDDQWADSYTLDGGGFTITVYRTGLCQWEGTDDNYPSGVGDITGTVSGFIVFYGNGTSDEEKLQRFEAGISYDFLPELQDAGAFSGTKENNNTPAGDYEFNGNVEITVT
jgi:hypothetical protein